MTTTYSTDAAGLGTTPTTKLKGAVVGGRMRRFRAVIPFAAQASGDDIVLTKVPAGHTFAFGMISATATFGASATIAIGIAGRPGGGDVAGLVALGGQPRERADGGVQQHAVLDRGMKRRKRDGQSGEGLEEQRGHREAREPRRPATHRKAAPFWLLQVHRVRVTRTNLRLRPRVWFAQIAVVE